MASTAVNVPNPVTTPTAVQLAQIAANIASVQFTAMSTGNYEDVYQVLRDLAAAVNCCAQALLAINNSTASSVGSVQTRQAYALGAAATIPTAIVTAAV
jgi:hypothetical protein